MNTAFLFFILNFLSGLSMAEEGDPSSRGAINNSTGCVIDTQPVKSGFNAVFYPYELRALYDEEYVKHGYKANAPVGSVEGIADINFNIDLPDDATLRYGEVYGTPISVSNFSLELTGYFYAEETGYYEVLFFATDDAVVFFFGTDSAFECCHSSELSQNANFADQVIYTTGSIDDDGRDFFASRYRYLQGGFYYPTRIAYTQIETYAYLNLTVTTPSGKRLRTFEDTVYQFDEKNSNCQSVNPFDSQKTTITTSVPWTGTETSTYTATFSNPSSPVEIVVETPDVYFELSTVTTTIAWTGYLTSTYTTTLSDPTLPVKVVVKSPSISHVHSQITTTVPWTGAGTSTYTATFSDPSAPDEVVIETPAASPQTFAAQPWSGNSTYNIAGPKLKTVNATYTTNTTDFSSVVLILNDTVTNATFSKNFTSTVAGFANTTSSKNFTNNAVIFALKNFTNNTVVFANTSYINVSTTAISKTNITEKAQNQTFQSPTPLESSTSDSPNSAAPSKIQRFPDSVPTPKGASPNVRIFASAISSNSTTSLIPTSSPVISSPATSTISTSLAKFVLTEPSSSYEPSPSVTVKSTSKTGYANKQAAPDYLFTLILAILLLAI